MTQEEFIDKVIDAGFKVTKDFSTGKYYIVDNINNVLLLDNNQGYLYKDYQSAIKGYIWKRSNHRDHIVNNIMRSLNSE